MSRPLGLRGFEKPCLHMVRPQAIFIMMSKSLLTADCVHCSLFKMRKYTYLRFLFKAKSRHPAGDRKHLSKDASPHSLPLHPLLSYGSSFLFFKLVLLPSIAATPVCPGLFSLLQYDHFQPMASCFLWSSNAQLPISTSDPVLEPPPPTQLVLYLPDMGISHKQL